MERIRLVFTGLLLGAYGYGCAVFSTNYDLQSTISMVSISYVSCISVTVTSNVLNYIQNERTIKINKDLMNVLHMPTLTINLCVLLVTVQIFLGKWNFETVPLIITFSTVSLLIKLYHLDVNESTYLKIIEDLELDVGSGMAHGFYNGYLKIVLPESGRPGGPGGIMDRFDNYEDNQNVIISRRKLFILIPTSGHLPPRLDGELDTWIERRTSLETLELHRAGVQNRPYSNSVYVIRNPDPEAEYEPFYICMEGATPLKTLDEACNGQTFGAEKLKENKKRITNHFYMVLKGLLDNDRTCGNLCELVYYDDEEERQNDFIIGKMIYDRYLNV